MRTKRPIARPLAIRTALAVSWPENNVSATTFAPERRAR
jgi:hypothetical protein